MRKKIIGVSMIVALLAILCAQSVAAQVAPDITVYAWTDKPQYKPGETGTLKITVLNEQDEPVEVKNVSITYPWFIYNGKTEEWEGNATVTEELPKWVNPEEVYYAEVTFAIPTDGRVAPVGSIGITVETGDGLASQGVSLLVSSSSLSMSIEDLDTWMTSLTVAIVVCTIILAIVVLLATRKPRASSALIPRAPLRPTPPKPKSKAQ